MMISDPPLDLFIESGALRLDAAWFLIQAIQQGDAILIGAEPGGIGRRRLLRALVRAAYPPRWAASLTAVVIERSPGLAAGFPHAQRFSTTKSISPRNLSTVDVGFFENLTAATFPLWATLMRQPTTQVIAVAPTTDAADDVLSQWAWHLSTEPATLHVLVTQRPTLVVTMGPPRNATPHVGRISRILPTGVWMTVYENHLDV